jgi:tetratricopeptide (TPR) repeat protein
MKRKNLSPSVRDYHSLHWLLYCYLQQGRYSKAEQLLALMKGVMSETSYENKLRPGYYENNYANMAAAFVVETERWELAAKLFPASATNNQRAVEDSGMNGHGHSGTLAISGDRSITVPASSSNQTLPLFVRGLSAAISGSAEVEQSINALRAMSSGRDLAGKRTFEIRELEIAALSASVKGNHQNAIEVIKKATVLEEEMGPPSGPPGLIKPAHELFGEILLRAQQGRAAAEEFKAALLRQPNRARSLLGLARAAAQSGNVSEATSGYAKLLDQWRQADEGLPELREAREYLKQAKP